MMSIGLGFVAVLFGFVTAIWGFLRYAVMMTTQVNTTTAKYLMTEIVKDKKYWHMKLSDTHMTDDEIPDNMSILARLPKIGFVRIQCAERLMTAGYQPKEVICIVTHRRFANGRMISLLRDIDLKRSEGERVTVEMITSYGIRPLGFIKPGSVEEPLQPYDLWADAETDIRLCAEGKRDRASILLYGPPGTGKTFFVRWLCSKYKIPIKMFVFTPDMTNEDILRRFANLPKRCLVLFEDFDNVFDLRVPVCGKDPKFTIDAVLSGIDGIFGAGENIIYAMTTNRIEKIDSAFKDRPNRFRHVIEFDLIEGKSSDHLINGFAAVPAERPESPKGNVIASGSRNGAVFFAGDFING